MKVYIHIFFVAFGLLISCKKEKPEPEPEPTPTPAPTQNPLPPCQDIPPPPQPFGWKDSSITDDRNVNFFRAQPYKVGDYVYCVNGEVFPLNRMYLYTYSSQQRIPLGERDEYIPDLSSNGWMVYSSPDKNIFKIKLNGDSLTQLTADGACGNAKWDPSGKYIYCYRQTTTLTASCLLKLNKNGQVLQSYLAIYPNFVPSKTPDKAYVLTVKNNRLVVLLRHLINNSETEITTSGFVLSSAQNDFFNLSIDPKEEYLYWSNSKGILRCNLGSKQVDTLFKNCASITYLNPIISQNSEELTFCCEVLRPLNSLVLHREYRSFEYNLKNKQWRELDFFPN